MGLDLVGLVQRQLERDRARKMLFPRLLERKIERMRASALGFLRGAAPLFYDLLRAQPELAAGPPGEGWLAGDVHVENFGVYRFEALHKGGSDRVAFDLNDFDAAFRGPWRLDVLRLATSMILLACEHRLDGAQALACGERVVLAHGLRRVPPPPPAVRALTDAAGARSRDVLLDGRTELVAGRRRFVRGPRYRSLPAPLARAARRAFKAYAPADDAFEVCDVAFRVAGTGSLGCLRIAVLTTGKGGKHGNWIFDMKEIDGSASRVRDALMACLAKPPRMTGTTRLAGRDMLVRRLAPQEDKLDHTRLQPAELSLLAPYLGALTGAAHRRGGRAARAWTDKDVRRLVTSAAELAGLHDACYLLFCDATSR